MDLSIDQQKALASLHTWFEYAENKQYITLGGYAGTGKTTLISIFKKELIKKNKTIRVAFCSFTGRAAQNLKNKLKAHGALKKLDTISTIHGLIYSPVENSNGEIVGWSKKEEVEYDLIIVDEASMVDETIWRDLLSYKIRTLAVGDHGQLPPINGKFNLMEKPEITLTQIHRQAEGNPIIKVATQARTKGAVLAKNYDSFVIKYSKDSEFSQSASTELLENYTSDTLILCGYNSTRTRINQYIRNVLGFESIDPEPGDRVICLRNNNKKAIYNGMLGTIQQISLKNKDWYEADILMDDTGNLYSGMVYKHQFGALQPINFTENRKLAMSGDLFDFGYALTVHKAQGSQAKRVVMFEERFKQMDDEMWKKWLYTGVTRAEEELYLFG